MEGKKSKPIEVVNRRAKHEYHFVDTFEAGIMLHGTEIKSVRNGQVGLTDSFCFFEEGELFIKNMYIKEYDFGTYFNHEPRRTRKLLLRRSELKKLERKVKERGFTIIPFRLFMSERGFAKIEIALVTGKKTYDKRDSIKERDQKRDLDRIQKSFKAAKKTI